MSTPKRLGQRSGIALGLLLSVTPFLRYRWSAPHSPGHMDHTPRHGGVLGMVGDRHLEIARSLRGIECHPSDAHRGPLDLVAGRVECGGVLVRGVVAEQRLVAADRCGAGEVTCEVDLADGSSLRMTAWLEAAKAGFVGDFDVSDEARSRGF